MHRQLGQTSERVQDHDQVSLWHFFDVVGVWLKEPLSAREFKAVNGACGKPLLGGWLRRDGPAPFNPSYCQGLRLLQPGQTALGIIAGRGDALVTYAELAADYCFIEREPVDAKSRLFNSKFVQLRHGMRTSTVFANGNGNTGKRGAGVTFQWYSDRPCKLTGEAECFHLEARIQGSRACKRHGITASTIASFDLAAWWDRQWAENKIGLYQIDAERFGRWLDNRCKRKRRRHPIVVRGFYNEDARRGALAKRILGGLQGVIDAYGTGHPYVHAAQANLLY